MISKRKYRAALPLVFLACFFVHTQSLAQTTFFTDQCDDGSLWTLGAGVPSGTYGEYTAWKMGNATSCTIDASSLSINVWNRNGGNAWSCEYVETTAADLIAKRTIVSTNFQTLQLKFDWMCTGENSGITIYDYGQVGYSTNGGSTFTWLTTGGGTGTGKYFGSPSIVRNETLTLPTALNNTQFVLGFRWINNTTTGVAPGFVVDNIRISGQLIGGGTLESPKIAILFDECKDDQGWILGKGPLFDGYTYTAWNIGNDTMCTIDKGTLAIGTWDGTKWICSYLADTPMDLKACKKIDARNYENLELQFDWNCFGESYPTVLYDYGEVGYSTDAGATFTWFGTGGTDAQGKYYGSNSIQRGQRLKFPAALNGKEFLLAFRWVNDNSVMGVPGFIVDNIKVSGSAKATQLTAIFKDNLDSRTGWNLKKANVDPAGNTLAWNIDRRCSINGNSLSINLYNNTTKQWDCGFATNAAADIVASRSISALGTRNLFLKFDWKVTSTATTDYAQIGYSTNDGVSFTWLSYGGTANSGKYYNQSGLVKAATVKLPASLEGKNFVLGIRWVNDAATNSGQAIIMDNISVVGEVTTDPPQPEQPRVNRITNEYVKLVNQKTEANVDALTEDGKIVEKNYFDGTERRIQQVMWKASPSKTDLVHPTLYDENGNSGTQFLPYKATTTDAGYHSEMLNEQYTYNTTAKANFTTTEYAFNQTLTENSPANRVKERGTTGKEFQPGLPGITRTKTQKFYTAIDNNPPNTVEAIKYITLAAGPSLSVNYYSVANGLSNLFVTEVIDEDKKMKKSYTDNTGKLILERSYATNGTTILTQTYYVYDEFDRLRVTIQPEGLRATPNQIPSIPATLSSAFMNDYCFQYNYDERGRLISKKAPGGGWMQLAYDRWDRAVITQDANQAAKNPQEFTYLKYDVQNRVIATGTFKAANRTLTIAAVRTELSNVSLGTRFETRTLGTPPNMDFTNNLTYPKADATNTLTPLIQNYYDDYKYTDLAGFAFTVYLGYTANSAVTNTNGLLTAVKTNVMGTSTWLTNVNYYDAYDRLIQNQQKNINGVKNFVTTEYDFQDRILKTIEDNKLTTVAVSLQNTNQYDHMGRLTRVLHMTNAQTEVVLADYKYTDLGTRVSEKNIHSNNLGASYLQSIDYTFNEKGWLTNINKTDLSNGGDLNNDANDIFGMEFKYYKGLEIDATKAVYNGNISEVIWRSTSANKKQGYLHTYDDLNRLTSATYRNFTTTAEHNRYNVGSITYDANGNIKTMQQSGLITGTTTFGLMDNLTYTYVGNRLTAVTDAVTAATSYPNDFQNGSNPIIAVDYQYDANGNLIFDDNKGISSITYNLLNLPEQAIMSNGKKTVYTYDAFGTKLKKQEYTGATLDRTYDYLGSVQYLNGTAQFAQTGEGRVYNNSGSYRYDYFMKDQVGNIRLIYTSNSGNVTVLQRDEYYPFGNTFDSYAAPTGANQYKFNGMEFQENGLNTFDFNARMYDPQLGRTFQLDPAADAFRSKSPYSFLANNPIKYTDPTGMYEDIADDLGDGDGTFGSISPGASISAIPGSWFLKSGGYTMTSKKWMGIVYNKSTNTYYYKGKQVSAVFAHTMLSFGRTPFYNAQGYITSSRFKENGWTGVEIAYHRKGLYQHHNPTNYTDRIGALDYVGYNLDLAGRAAEAQAKAVFRYAQGTKNAAEVTLENAKFFKGVATKLNIAGGVVGAVDCTMQAVDDFSNGDYALGTYETAKATSYTVGLAMCTNPATIALGVTIIGVTGLIDFAGDVALYYYGKSKK